VSKSRSGLRRLGESQNERSLTMLDLAVITAALAHKRVTRQFPGRRTTR
jgi:hypothetical protein